MEGLDDPEEGIKPRGPIMKALEDPDEGSTVVS